MSKKADYHDFIQKVKLYRKKGYKILIIKSKWIVFAVSLILSVPLSYLYISGLIAAINKAENKFGNYKNHLIKINTPKLLESILLNVENLSKDIDLNKNSYDFSKFHHLGYMGNEEFDASLLSLNEIRTSKQWAIHKSKTAKCLFFINDRYRLFYMLDIDDYTKGYHFSRFNKVVDYKNGTVYASISWAPLYFASVLQVIIYLILIQIISISLFYIISIPFLKQIYKNKEIDSYLYFLGDIIYDNWTNKGINIILIGSDKKCVTFKISNSRKLFTEPQHFLDRFLWPLLRLIWEPFSKKRSHWWHWKNTNLIYAEKNSTLTIKGNPSAGSRSGFWRNLWQTNFGWKSALIIKPKLSTKYKVGFFDHKEAKICSIIMDGEIALLEGSDPVNFFAFSYPENEPIQLEIVKNNILKKDIPKNIYLF